MTPASKRRRARSDTAARRGNPRIAPTAHYTAQAWVHDGFPNAERFDTWTGRLLFGAAESARSILAPVLPAVLRHAQEYLFIRHHAYEERLRQLDPDFVLEVGAGLSPRGLTFAGERPGLTYVEADLPHMVEEKRRRLRGATLPPNYHLVTIDLLGSGLSLPVAPAAGQRVLAITEGVIDYLSMEEKAAAWGNLASFLRAAGGGHYLCEIHPASRHAEYAAVARLAMRTIGALAGGLSFEGRIFRNPAAALALLRQSGFDDAAVLDTARLNRSRHRPPMRYCHWLLVEATVGEPAGRRAVPVRGPRPRPAPRARTKRARSAGRSFTAAAVMLWGMMVVAGGCGDADDGAAALPHTPPRPAIRGVVEGFYGPLYEFDARLDLLSFLPRAGLDTYLYAPKLDPYHRGQWREPYPVEWVDHFRELARRAERLGVRFVYGLSPGNDFDPAGDDAAAVMRKLAVLMDAGVREFCLLFDDLEPASKAADPRVQVDLVTETLSFLRRRDARAGLWFISHFYAGTAAEVRTGRTLFDRRFRIKSAAAYEAYAALPADVPILWTGPRVFADTLSAADTADFRALVGRPLVIWDNFPVNDTFLTEELFLGPYPDREPGIAANADGILLNPMLQPESSKIALWTAGRFFADPSGYDSEAAWREALREVAGSGAGARAVELVADQFRGHPLIGSGREAAEMAELAAAFFDTGSAQSEESLRRLLRSFASAAEDVERDVPNRRLAAELRAPAGKLSLFGRAGLVGLDLVAAKRSGEPVDTGEYERLLDEARAVPWLVGANSEVLAGLDQLLAGRPAVPADVFGDFFARLTEQIGSGG